MASQPIAISQRARLGPNARLIGDRRARAKLSTPALLLELDALKRNIARMAEAARKSGVQLRPHAKCHKSVAIARLQLDAGAVGICCATIGEAEIMAAGGITDILITSPLTTEAKLARAVSLSRRGVRLCLVADHPRNAEQIAAHFGRARRRVGVLVDVDAGLHRTGVTTQKRAIELARLLDGLDAIDYRGIQCFAGHVQHVGQLRDRQESALAVLGALKVLCEELKVVGLAPATVSGGGTGTCDIDGPAGVLTELQVGSYVFMDAQYNRVWAGGGQVPPFEVSLLVQASVVSNNHAGSATCDAGIKHFAVDGGAPVVARGAPATAAYRYFGDEHGCLRLPRGVRAPDLGERIEFIVPHCDPTVGLYDHFHCMRGNELVDIWPIEARGA